LLSYFVLKIKIIRQYTIASGYVILRTCA